MNSTNKDKRAGQMKKTWMIGLWMGICAVASAIAAEQLWELPPMATWTEDPATSVTLAWERTQPGRMTLQYGPVGNEQEFTIMEAGDPARRHVQTLRNLLPFTAYHYRITDGEGYEVEGRFKTAPNGHTTPFTFVLHNDLQGGLQHEPAREVSVAILTANPDFIISTGDLGDSRYAADYAGVIQSWNDFFSLLKDELAQFVFQPVAGNHDEPENPDSFWYRLMELPGDKRSYTFDVGPIRFVGVDSSEFEVPAQTPWLARTLQEAAYDETIRWVIPLLHRPPFSEGDRGGQGIVRDWWVPLFTRYEVDLVLSGHAHTYQRFIPYDGVDYLVSAGGGGHLYAINPTHPQIAFATSTYHFAQFHVNDRSIRLEAIDRDGAVFDTHVYEARRHVRVEPAFPVRGESCTIWYDAAGGPLEDQEEVWLHLGRDEFNNLLMDLPMEKADNGQWRATFTVPDSPKWNLAFCFFEPTKKIWHNNYKQNWQTLLRRDW